MGQDDRDDNIRQTSSRILALCLSVRLSVCLSLALKQTVSVFERVGLHSAATHILRNELEHCIWFE